MADSLQQQLINAGLVTQERAQELSKPKPKRPPKAAKSPDKKGRQKDRPSGARGDARKRRDGGRNPAAAEQKKAAKAAKAAELEAQAVAELAQKRELKAKIKQLIEDNSITDFSGELSFSYVVGERIRQLFVRQEFLDKISAGELAITRLNRQTHLVSPEIAEQLLALNPQWLVVRHDPNQPQPQAPTEEDPYADYKVPDDLHW